MTINLGDVITISDVIALAAIVSPIFVAFINGCFKSFRLISNHHHELKIEKWNKYYKECMDTFSLLLKSLGELLSDPVSDRKVPEVLGYIYNSYTFADDKLISVLDEFYKKLEAWNLSSRDESKLNDIQAYTIILSRDINRFLQEQVVVHSKQHHMPNK